MPDSPDRPAAPARLDITAADPHTYDVTITHPTGAETAHRVTVPEQLMADLGVSAAQEPLLVRASLAYLMEHDPGRAARAVRPRRDRPGRAGVRRGDRGPALRGQRVPSYAQPS